MKPSLVIVGLGNPGPSYVRTRHNAGFRAVDILAETFGGGAWKPRDKFTSECSEGRIVTVPVLFVKPQTFMNLSGDAVRTISTYYKLPPDRVLILNDEIDIPLGTLRLKTAGGPGTHNGLKSVVDALGEGFPRLRIGIGPKPATGDLAAWVLSVPSPEESAELEKVLQRVPDVVREFVVEGKTTSE